jgi:hypothetical protein
MNLAASRGLIARIEFQNAALPATIEGTVDSLLVAPLIPASREFRCHDLPPHPTPESCRSAVISLLRRFFGTVARHEQHHTGWLLHPCRPQDLSLASADDRRHDGAQLRTEHYAGLPETGQLLRPTFRQVTRTVKCGRYPQLPDLPGQGEEGSISSRTVAASALRFLYAVTLKQDRVIEMIPTPKAEYRLPVILSPEEVLRLLEALPPFLTT